MTLGLQSRGGARGGVPFGAGPRAAQPAPGRAGARGRRLKGMALEFEARRAQVEHRAGRSGLGLGVLPSPGPCTTPGFAGSTTRSRRRRAELDGPQQEIQKGRAAERKLSQFREESQAPGARARQAPPDPSLPAQHGGPDQADRDADAPGRFRVEEVHAGRVHPQGLLLGVADRHLARGHLPQPRALLRPDEPLLAHRQRRGDEDRPLEAPGKSIAASFVAKTFIYTADE